MLDVLVIDDERDIGELVKDITEEDLGLNTDFVLNSASALEALKTTLPQLIILDVWLEGSDMDGLGLLKVIQENYKHIPVIVISGHANIETAIRAIKLGAYDFIEKPFKSEKLVITIKRTLENIALREYNHQLKQQSDLLSLVGKSKQIIDIKNKIITNATHNTRILIYGEIGVGKEKLARLIHSYSNSSEKPFFKVNLGNHSEKELNEILFGTANSASIFEKAKGATLYINEIYNLSPPFQEKLLQYINTTQANVDHTQKCKIICSSRNNIKELVDLGNFNPTLYQRLCDIALYIPPLRDRKQDIQPTIDHYIEQFSKNYCLSNLKVTNDFYLKLISYDWPGNIMELKNVIENSILKVILLGKKILDSSIIQLSISKSESSDNKINLSFYSKTLKEAKKAFEKEYIEFQLKRFGNNISRTARFIGIERPALHKKIKDLDF